MFFNRKKKPEEIIALLRAGNTEVIKDFYADGFKSVKKHIKSNSGNDADAEDVYQESIMLFLKKIAEPDFQLTTTIEGYLFGVSQNIWHSKLRKQKVSDGRLVQSKSFLTAISEDEVNWIESATIKLQDYLTNLGTPCFEILNMYYYQKLSMRQIAINMNYSSEDTAKTTKNRCINKLRALMV